MKVNLTSWLTLLTLLFVLVVHSSTAGAASTAVEITGEIEHLTLDTPLDVYSGGVMIVGGTQVILPKNLLIDLPANRLSLQQIFDQAPAGCKALGESGLAKADKCNASGTGGFATFSGVHSNAGNVIAGDVLIEKGKEATFGVVSYISYSDGFFRVNGIPNDPATGVMVRLNDPTSRHTVQQGLGCAGGPNCSPDPRFTLDPDNYVITFSTGYPVCIPSTVSRTFASVPSVAVSPAQSSLTGTGDALCPHTNRTPGAVIEPPVNDSRLFAPILVGDSLIAEGNYEMINGVRFLSVHTMRVNKALSTKDQPDQPDYMFLEEVFVEAPGFQNQRARALIIGYTTLAPTDVDFWSIHRDPKNNSVHEFPLASVQGCDNVAGIGTCSSQGLLNAGANIFRIRYDVDFLLAASGKTFGGANAKLSPCLQLQGSSRFASSNPGLCPGGATLENNFGIMSPIPHEIQARTGHNLVNPGLDTKTLDINGNKATNGQYLFPFGMNLGGIETADFLETDINQLTTPRVFEGIPWNLDRRLSPSGCLKGGCEATPQPLDPFPYTGLDPRTQANFLVAGLPGGTPKGTYSDPNFTASTLSIANNRVFSFIDPLLGKFNGNSTLLPYVLGSFPADPPLTAIVPTPALAIFAPIAVNDSITTDKNVPVTINLTGNDVPVLGAVDPATLQIVTFPAKGTLSGIVGGSVTYTPTDPTFVGVDTFTYKVASTSGGGVSGGYSNVATVTITVVAKPTANPDTAMTFTGSPQITINVIANDIPGSFPINPASVNIVSPLPANGSCGTATTPNPGNGTILYTAPLAVPAGTCTFSYTVSDSSTPPRISNVANVTVTVTPANFPPVVNPDTAFTTVNSTIFINVLANDTTTSAFNLNSVSLTQPAAGGGTVTHIGNGIIQYAAPAVPNVYTFTYTVQDVNGLPAIPAPTFVTVTVASPPQAFNDGPQAMVGGAGTSTVIDILFNDTAFSPATLNPSTVTIVNVPGKGSAVVNPVDGKVTYSPNPGFVGTDTFTYTVKDSQGVVSTPATVSITVNAPATESLTVTGAQYIVSSDTWQIDGTSTNQNGTVNIYNSSIAGTASLGTASVDGNGNWTHTRTGFGQPNIQLQISVQSAANAAVILEGITLVVR